MFGDFLISADLRNLRLGLRLRASDISDSSDSSRRRGPWIKNLRLGGPLAIIIEHIRIGCAIQLTCGKEHCRCPRGEEIESGDKLRGKGGQKGPVPSQQLDQD